MEPTLLQSALAIAEGQEGICEQPKGSNRGPEVDAYIKCVGLDPKGKYAWCAAFVYWCFNNAAAVHKTANPLVKTAGCLFHWNATKAKRISKSVALADPNLIKPGHIFIMKFGTSGAGHTGMVVSVDAKAKTIRTIEGNTNDDGSREGYEVAKRTRTISSMLGFIDYSGA
jgi:hypothetical protein